LRAQCCIGLSNRIIALEGGQKPSDYRGAIIRLGESGVLPSEFVRCLAPIAGLRNILIHEYVSVNWDEVYRNLQQLDDLIRFAELVRDWLRRRG